MLRNLIDIFYSNFRLSNRYPDITSDDEQIIIECGDTDPNKIIEHFDLGVAKILILPCPNIESKNFRDNHYKEKIKKIIKKR